MQQVWFITGSSRGLGRALAASALAAGHRVVATARNVAPLEDLSIVYESLHLVTLDVTEYDAAVSALRETVERFGRLDVVVNNAGYGNVGSIEDTSLEEIRAQIEANLFGTINVTKAALTIMREQHSGHFIQISSIGGRIGAMGRAPYSAAKFGVEGFSESLARETAPLGIKVTIVEPGGFRTDFAGSSSVIDAGRPEYDSTVGEAARFQRKYNGAQPGDPSRAAEVILHIAGLQTPPLHLALGTDAFNAIENSLIERLAELRRWRDLSESTDYALT